MAVWNKLKEELDRAGRAAQNALDEGRVRLDAFRARQLADKAAQSLGYALYRARQGGGELDADTYARLSSALAAREAEAATLERKLDEVRESRGTSADSAAGNAPGGAAPEGGSTAEPPPAPEGGTA